MLRFFFSLALALLLACLSACPSQTGGGGGGRDGKAGVDVDVGFVDQKEASRAAAADFAPALASDDDTLRAHAVRALARLERLDAITPITRALADSSAAVRAEAAFAAGQVDLALDGKRPAHEEARAVVEASLLEALAKEQNAMVRTALVRALGRLSSSRGLDALLRQAQSSSSTEKAQALYALGVSGARRQASKTHDEALLAATNAGLGGNDEEVRAAAAYAAFRQKLAVLGTAATAALRGGEQTRIFLARSMASADPAVADAALPTLLQDADWRVQVEAIRVTAQRSDLHVDRIPAVLDAATKNPKKPGAQHVITEACLALADVGAPSTALPAVSAAVTALGAEKSAVHARCTCAAAVEVLGGDANAVESCSEGLPGVQKRLYALVALGHLRVPSAEQAKALQPYVVDESVLVRMNAASTLCEKPSVAAADVAATRLLDEDDPGVASALLECFADGAFSDVLRDGTLVTSARRFTAGTTFEAVEPLLAIANTARGRPGANMKTLVAQLAQHADARVADAAKDVPVGERGPGPRALVLPTPAVGSLPLAAILHTARGDVTIAFERDIAPRTVKNFVDLAQKGTYNNTPFHRVIGDFVSQGGDPRGDGSGGPGFTIPCENSDAAFTRGAVGMAHAGKDTGGSQFFLTHSHQPHLDGRYTLFARVVDGADVMDALQKGDLLVSVELTTALRGQRK